MSLCFHTFIISWKVLVRTVIYLYDIKDFHYIYTREMFIIVLSDDKNFYKIGQFSFDDSQHTEIIFYNIGSSYRLEAKKAKRM